MKLFFASIIIILILEFVNTKIPILEFFVVYVQFLILFFMQNVYNIRSVKKVFYETLKKLCEKNNTTITQVLKKMNISTSKGTAWKKGSIPNGAIIQKIADYFEVSTDFLLTGKEKTAEGIELTAVDKEVIEIVSKLSDEKKMLAYKMLKTLQDEN